MSEASKIALAYGLTATVLLSAAIDCGWLGALAFAGLWLLTFPPDDEPTDP